MRLDIPERLEAPGVVLRPLRAPDAVPYAAAFAEDPDLGRFLGIERDPSPEQAAERIDGVAESAAAGRWLELAITAPADDAFLGTVMLHSVSEPNRRCEIGFWLVPSARGAGIATAAVSRFLDWIFDALPIDRIEMTTTPDNRATRRLAARLGFTEEGRFRERNIERGQRVDLVAFGLLRTDRPAVRDD